jgi:hypothetical protein
LKGIFGRVRLDDGPKTFTEFRIEAAPFACRPGWDSRSDLSVDVLAKFAKLLALLRP